MKLYDIPKEIQEFESILIDNGGELTPELEQKWSEFVGASKDKLESAAFVICSLEDDADACKAEVDRLRGRKDSIDRNVKRLKDLTLFALKALGGKLKTALVTMYSQSSAKQFHVDAKAGTDLVELEKTHPQFVRTTRELRLSDLKQIYVPLWQQIESEREADLLLLAPDHSREEEDKILAKHTERWQQLLKEKGLPDSFVITMTPGTESLRIR